MATTERDVLEAKVLPELQAIASSMGVQGYFRLRKADLIGAIIAKARGEEYTPTASPTRSRRSAANAEPASAKPAAEPADASGAAQAPAAEDTAPAEPAAGDSGAKASDKDTGQSISTQNPPATTPQSSDSPEQGTATDGGSQPAEAPAPQPATETAAPEPAPAAASEAAPAAQQSGGRSQEQPGAPATTEATAGGQPEDSSGDTSGDQPRSEQPTAPQGEQAASQDEQAGGQDAGAAQEGDRDAGGSTRRRRRRSRGSGEDTTNPDQLQGILSAVTSGVTPVSAPAENGEAPSGTDTTQAPSGGDAQPDGQREGGQRRDWGQGGRWDSGPGSGSGGGRSRRSRNRNRNRNRFGGGDVAVADRPDYRDRSGQPDDRPEVSRTGILDIRSQDGYGFLRVNGFLPGPDDVYVPLSMIRRLGLRRGDEVEAMVKLPRDNSDKYAACSRVDKVNGQDPEQARSRTDFKNLTPLYPNERLRLEYNPTEISTRIMDLMSPIGKGQRGLIVSPPKAGKTTIMKQIANAVSENNPEVHQIILLTGERPEEVTDMQRSTKAEVIYSTFDRPTEDHCQIAELTVERAKRLVEYGRDVMILLDGITRLSRAYNLATPASGKILSGGVDSSALYPPKRFFGAARNLEEGGSLTILATALVDTGSRMDEVIFEEFKGTGNMEVRLDRKLSERRIFPALDIDASSTRKEDLLLEPEELVVAWKLRRVLGALEPAQALELVVDRMRQGKTNAQFLRDIQRANIGGG